MDDASEDVDATASFGERATRSAALDAEFPFPGWDRYQPVRLLGQGGMGRVFLARDPRLQRDVALKFVRGDDLTLAHRFLVEARAQARVAHARVAKVFEVGEVRGRVYIAMQFIDGRPLSALVRELTVEQKVLLVHGAALGVNEAHRAGLIHRDIKPSNIMVEETADGTLAPYVVDFGLARSINEGTTLTGSVLGTPYFMAPEQARGEVSQLDRRTDVYGLGATLYYLLSGAYPIPGDNALEVLSNIATAEPQRLRAHDPELPIDLEAIVLKCLEKDRSARYDSARALADDLQRFLDAEPVTARSAGLWYRAKKRIVKHKRLTLAAASVVFALGWGVLERLDASEREHLARRFTERAERMEAVARYADLSPLHDMRDDQRLIEAEMAALEAEIQRAGAIARGPGQYALGRGFLALGQPAKARERLEAAWAQGFREPRVAYTLALVKGHFYRQAMREVESIKSPKLREERTRGIQREHREPALNLLAKSTGAAVPSADYLAALVAFYEDRLDAALVHLDAVSRSLPWFYEAPLLRGDILIARASSHWKRGRAEEARADFDAGRSAYAAAAAIGESVPAVHEAMGELEYVALRMALYGEGNVEPCFERGVAAADRALAVQPDHYDALVLRARLRCALAEHETHHGRSADALLAGGIADAERALAIAPERPEARRELVLLYEQWGEYRQGRDLDPREQLEKAIELARGIGAEHRDYGFHVLIGLTHKVRADYEDSVGLDSAESRSRAIDAFTHAIELDDGVSSPWLDLGINYFERASGPNAVDPERDLTKAIEAMERGRSINPKHIVPYFYEGEIYALFAARKRERGVDPRPDLARALERYRGGLTIDPAFPHLLSGVGSVHAEAAKDAWDRGEDPGPLLERARDAYEQALSAAPEQALVYNNIGAVFIERALYERKRGDDPRASLRAARAALEQAVKRLPDNAALLGNLGMAYAMEAGDAFDRGRAPSADLARANAVLTKAIERDPKEALAHFYLGETRGIEARLAARSGGLKIESFERAVTSFEAGIALAPENREEWLPFGHFCRAWASLAIRAKLDPTRPLERGLAFAEALLDARPGWPDAQVLRASLLLLQARRTIRPEEQVESARRAREDFARAFSANRNLERAWAEQARLTEQITAAVGSASR